VRNVGAVVEIAYILISLNRSTPAAVAREVREVLGVVDAQVTMGEFDVIALVETDNTKRFPAVAAEIQRIEGVLKVSTCVVVRP
jgi:DNA-binding Lrp family transcriptional regulator